VVLLEDSDELVVGVSWNVAHAAAGVDDQTLLKEIYDLVADADVVYVNLPVRVVVDGHPEDSIGGFLAIGEVVVFVLGSG